MSELIRTQVRIPKLIWGKIKEISAESNRSANGELVNILESSIKRVDEIDKQYSRLSDAEKKSLPDGLKMFFSRKKETS